MHVLRHLMGALWGLACSGKFLTVCSYVCLPRSSSIVLSLPAKPYQTPDLSDFHVVFGPTITHIYIAFSDERVSLFKTKPNYSKSLHTNLPVVNFLNNLCLNVQPSKLVHVWHILPHECLLYKWLNFCLLHYTAPMYRTVVQYLNFKARMSGSRCKSSGDIAGTTVLFRVLYC